MSLSEWSEEIIVANLQDEPELSDDLATLCERFEGVDNPPSVVLDFHDVGYINSTNIAQMLELRKCLTDAGAELRICAMQGRVQEVMIVTGLNRLFRYESDTTMALAALQIGD